MEFFKEGVEEPQTRFLLGGSLILNGIEWSTYTKKFKTHKGDTVDLVAGYSDSALSNLFEFNERVNSWLAAGGVTQQWKLMEALPSVDYGIAYATRVDQVMLDERYELNFVDFFKDLTQKHRGEVAEVWSEWKSWDGKLPTQGAFYHPQFATSLKQLAGKEFQKKTVKVRISLVL